MRKVILVTLVLLLITALIAGCTPSVTTTIQTTTKPTGSTTAATTTASTAEPKNFNETGYPIVNEQIVINVMNAQPANGGPWGDDMSFFRGMKELTNIDFTFSNTPASDWQTKMNLSLAAGDLPDVYMSAVYAENIFNYGVRGNAFVDISGLIDTYMPFMLGRMEKYPDLLRVVTQLDGSIYSFPRILITATAGTGNMYVRTDYMKEAGIMEEPKTVDEFYTMLKAIQERFSDDPEFTTFMPYTVARLNTHYEEWLIGALGNFVTSGFEADSSGKVFYNGTSNQFYRYLEFTHRLFAEKILSNELYTMDSSTELAILMDGKAAVSTFGTNYKMETFSSGNYDVAMLGPLTSQYTAEKKLAGPNVVSDSTVVITTKCEHVEAMLRWYDILYSEEDVAPGLNSISPWQGVRGETWDFSDDTKQYWVRLIPEGMNMDPGTWIMTYGAPQNYLGLDFMALAKGGTPGNEIKGRDALAKVFPYYVDRFPIHNLKYTDEEMERYTTLMTDIQTYVDQMKSKFISGIEPLTNYDTYVSTLGRMGLDSAIEIVQAAYDRYIE
jgi:putative aldouronate transport system substrate-binding protein